MAQGYRQTTRQVTLCLLLYETETPKLAALNPRVAGGFDRLDLE